MDAGVFCSPSSFAKRIRNKNNALHPIMSIHQHSRVRPARFVHFSYFNFPCKRIFLSYFILLKFYIYF